ncbi:MAG TPA: hypothetical protein VIU61_11750, partial [Kofleriaceae bacterium]
MAVVWLEPGPESNWTHYRALIDEHGWRDGEPFHDSESDLDECPFVTPDGTRVIIYHPKGGVTYGGERAIAVVGDDAERVADLIAKRLPIAERRVEPVFHRHKAIHTAACAGDGGVWYLASEHGVVMWQDAIDNAIPRIVAEGIPSSVALAGGADGLYITSCDDPLASRLARVDPRTGAVTWLCDGIERPTQLAVIGTTVYVACASGLLAVDSAGNRELVAHDAPRPYLLASALGALYWIDAGQDHLVRFANGRTEILATGGETIALDVDHERVYVLETTGRVRECRSGRATKTLVPITDEWRPEIGGILRLGPMIVTGEQWDDSYSIRSRCDLAAIGFPLVDEAPPELVAQLATDASAAEVLADWLAERGVVATADQLLATVGKPLTWGSCTDERGGELAP